MLNRKELYYLIKKVDRDISKNKNEDVANKELLSKLHRMWMVEAKQAAGNAKPSLRQAYALKYIVP
jgi:hypothetical protein